MDHGLGLSRALRTTRRVRDIVAVLVHHGFDDLVQGLGIDRTLRRLRRVVARRGNLPEPRPTSDPERIRHLLEDLGPTFVKLGQVLATRSDLVPPEWSLEFKKLHSDAPPVPWPAIERRLDEEYGARRAHLFEWIEPEPIAAASIAQVHRARLRGGAPVVLKILRPKIRELIAADVALMRTVASLIEHRFESFGYSPLDVVEQFARQIERETDLIREGQSTERLARAFADDARIRFATIHWPATTRSVLAMEELRGQLLARCPIEELTREQRHRIVAHCADAVFQQCFELGFFHADPHPGNLMILPGEVVGFLDCGMTGHVDPDTAGHLADLVRGTIDGDLEMVVRTAVIVAEADPALAYDRRLRADCWEYMGEFASVSLADLRVGPLLREFFDVLRRNRIRCAADVVYLIKAIATIEGVAVELAPDFDLVAHVQPRIRDLVKRRYGARALRRRIERSVGGYAEILETLPFQVREVMDRFKRSRLSVRIDHHGLEHLERTLQSSANTLAHALVIGAGIVGSSVLLLADSVSERRTPLTWLAVAGFVASILLGLLRVARLWLGRGR